MTTKPARTTPTTRPGEGSWGFTSSTGQDFTHTTIVDAHFAACRAAYLDILDGVGITPGARVLDAGCGSGSFVPHLAGSTGPTGRVFALDLAPEHVDAVRARVRAGGLPCPVDVRRGSVVDLPYEDGSFDIVWCANTFQYLDDEEARRALAEFRRVARPGAVVAVKELDPTLVTVRPGDPFLFADYFRSEATRPGYARRLLRARELYRLLREAGLRSVSQRTVLIEHFAPLSPEATAFYAPTCASFAARAAELGLGGDWAALADPRGPAHPLNHPDGYISEGNVIATGIVP